MLSLGITSYEELQDLLQQKEINSLFLHNSMPSKEMFNIAKNRIDRAKNNVIKYLKQEQFKDIYNLDEIEFISTTTADGATKYGRPIKIVVRPSDGGEVILYYKEEKDTLDFDDYELWIEDDINNPECLTFGKILKLTGVNKIPLKKIDDNI